MRPPASTCSLSPYMAGSRFLAARFARLCAMDIEHRVCHYEKCPRTLFRHRSEGAVELVGPPSLQELKLHSQRPGGGFEISNRGRLAWIGRVREDRHVANLRDSRLE